LFHRLPECRNLFDISAENPSIGVGGHLLIFPQFHLVGKGDLLNILKTLDAIGVDALQFVAIKERIFLGVRKDISEVGKFDPFSSCRSSLQVGIDISSLNTSCLFGKERGLIKGVYLRAQFM
jgi:hypothetical protein